MSLPGSSRNDLPPAAAALVMMSANDARAWRAESAQSLWRHGGDGRHGGPRARNLYGGMAATEGMEGRERAISMAAWRRRKARGGRCSKEPCTFSGRRKDRLSEVCWVKINPKGEKKRREGISMAATEHMAMVAAVPAHKQQFIITLLTVIMLFKPDLFIFSRVLEVHHGQNSYILLPAA